MTDLHSFGETCSEKKIELVMWFVVFILYTRCIFFSSVNKKFGMKINTQYFELTMQKRINM